MQIQYIETLAYSVIEVIYIICKRRAEINMNKDAKGFGPIWSVSLGSDSNLPLCEIVSLAALRVWAAGMFAHSSIIICCSSKTSIFCTLCTFSLDCKLWQSARGRLFNDDIWELSWGCCHIRGCAVGGDTWRVNEVDCNKYLSRGGVCLNLCTKLNVIPLCSLRGDSETLQREGAVTLIWELFITEAGKKGGCEGAAAKTGQQRS